MQRGVVRQFIRLDFGVDKTPKALKPAKSAEEQEWEEVQVRAWKFAAHVGF